MKYLILGGAGFIGHHLALRLLSSRQSRVVVIDNLSTSSHQPEAFALYKNLYEFHNENIVDMDDKVLLKMMKKADIIYHLAGSVGVSHIDQYPKETLHNNLNLMNKLMPLFEQAKTHVVFASTSEVYGEGPFSEGSNASIGPSTKLRWGYAAAKLLNEFMLRAAGIPFNVVRFFNVVGPGQLGDYGMVLPRFIDAAKEGRDLVVYGTGEQVRAFCHVKDAIELLMRVHEHPDEIFNIGNEHNAITIKALATRIIQHLDTSSVIEYRGYGEEFSDHHDDIMHRVPVTSKIEAMTGYTPKYTIDNIIEDMI